MEILHIDDHPIFCSGLLTALTKELPCCNFYHATDAQQALIIIESQALDLILLDLLMPGISGISFMRMLIERNWQIPIAVLSANEDVRDIQKALSLGAIAFLPKSWGQEQIAHALLEIEQGQVIIPEHIQLALTRHSKKIRPNNQTELGISKRQLDILKLIEQGLGNKEIAEVLLIGENTVKTHIKALFQIFNSKNRLDCVHKARLYGVL